MPLDPYHLNWAQFNADPTIIDSLITNYRIQFQNSRSQRHADQILQTLLDLKTFQNAVYIQNLSLQLMTQYQSIVEHQIDPDYSQVQVDPRFKVFIVSALKQLQKRLLKPHRRFIQYQIWMIQQSQFNFTVDYGLPHAIAIQENADVDFKPEFSQMTIKATQNYFKQANPDEFSPGQAFRFKQHLRPLIKLKQLQIKLLRLNYRDWQQKRLLNDDPKFEAIIKHFNGQPFQPIKNARK